MSNKYVAEICTECGIRATVNPSGVCNGCKYRIKSERVVVAETNRDDVAMKGCAGIMLMMLFMSALMAALIFVNSQEATPAVVTQPNNLELNAVVEARGYVLEKLLSPSSADFPMFDGYVVKDQGNNKFLVVLDVESKNAFGTMIPSRWKVQLTHLGDYKWQAISVVQL